MNDIQWIKSLNFKETNDYKIGLFLCLKSTIYRLITNNCSTNYFELGRYPDYLSGKYYPLSYVKNPVPTGITFTLFDDKSIIKKVKIFGSGKHFDDYSFKRVKKTYSEYEYNGRKFIKYHNGKEKVWVEVLPILWKANNSDKSIMTVDSIANGRLEEVPRAAYNKNRFEDRLYKIRGVHLRTIKKLKISDKLTREEIKTIVSDIVKTIHIVKHIKYIDYNDLNEKLDRIAGMYSVLEIILEGPPLTPSEKESIAKVVNNNKITYVEILPKEKSKNEIINDIIDNIYELLDFVGDSNNIKSDVAEKLSKYNAELKTSNNRSWLFQNLIVNLNNILDSLNYKKYMEHIKIYKFLNRCIGILDNDDVEVQTDIEKDILKLKREILPFVDNSSIANQLKERLLNEREAIVAYIKGDDNSSAKFYKSLDDYYIVMRNILQKYLILLKCELEKKDLIREFKILIPSIIEGQKVKSENEYINSMMSEIHKNVIVINEKGNLEEKRLLCKLNDCASVLENDDFEGMINNLNRILMNTIRVLNIIKRREIDSEELNEYTVRIKERD